MTPPELRPTIITLSTIPPRLPHLAPVLDGLLAQDLPAQQIILYVPRTYWRFPDWDGMVPDLPAGITLRRVDTDYGPATKLLPALTEFAGQDVDILYCDDDTFYPPAWHRAFKTVASLQPGKAIAGWGYDLKSIAEDDRAQDHLPRAIRFTSETLGHHMASLPPPLPIAVPRCQSSGLVDIAQGHSGILVRPEWFAKAVFDVPPRHLPVDDIWFSGHLATQGRQIWMDVAIPQPRSIDPLHWVRGLYGEKSEGMVRKTEDAACVQFYRDTHRIWGSPAHVQSELDRTRLKHTKRRNRQIPQKPGLLRRVWRAIKG